MRAALLIVSLLALAAAPAFAENGYDAQLVAQSPNLTLESGVVGDSYFDATNVEPRSGPTTSSGSAPRSPRTAAQAWSCCYGSPYYAS